MSTQDLSVVQCGAQPEETHKAIQANPCRDVLLRRSKIDYASDYRHTLALCCDLAALGRAEPNQEDFLLAELSKLPKDAQNHVIFYFRGRIPKPPRGKKNSGPKRSVFVPGIYVSSVGPCCPTKSVFVLYPGLRAASTMGVQQGCHESYHNGLEDSTSYDIAKQRYKLGDPCSKSDSMEDCIDFALDSSLPTHKIAYHSSQRIVWNQGEVKKDRLIVYTCRDPKGDGMIITCNKWQYRPVPCKLAIPF